MWLHFIHEADLFKGMSHEVIEEIDKVMFEESHEKGACLFREGEYNPILDQWDIYKEGEGYIIDSGGEFTLTFELVIDNIETYILIHAKDSFESKTDGS